MPDPNTALQQEASSTGDVPRNLSVFDRLDQAAATMPEGIKPLVLRSLNALALTKRGREYLEDLTHRYGLPGADGLRPAPELLLEGFRHVDVEQAQAFVFLESPYPTEGMANGRAFFPALVQELWKDEGINADLPSAFQAFLKTLLAAANLLSDPDDDAEVRRAVAQVIRVRGIATTEALFARAYAKGIYFLNACLVYDPARGDQEQRNNVPWHEVRWRRFNIEFLKQVRELRSEASLPSLYLVGGKAANLVNLRRCQRITAEFPRHLFPYPTADEVGNFIRDQRLHALFRPANLLGLATPPPAPYTASIPAASRSYPAETACAEGQQGACGGASACDE